MTNMVAIGLYDHGSIAPKPSEIFRIYETIEQMIRCLGREPSLFSADDSAGRGQWNKFGGTAHKRFLRFGGEKYTNVGLCVAPDKGKFPDFDREIEANFIFMPVSGDVILEICVQEKLLVNGCVVESIIDKFAPLWRWCYGFGINRDSKKMANDLPRRWYFQNRDA